MAQISYVGKRETCEICLYYILKFNEGIPLGIRYKTTNFTPGKKSILNAWASLLVKQIEINNADPMENRLSARMMHYRNPQRESCWCQGSANISFENWFEIWSNFIWSFERSNHTQMESMIESQTNPTLQLVRSRCMFLRLHCRKAFKPIYNWR